MRAHGENGPLNTNGKRNFDSINLADDEEEKDEDIAAWYGARGGRLGLGTSMDTSIKIQSDESSSSSSSSGGEKADNTKDPYTGAFGHVFPDANDSPWNMPARGSQVGRGSGQRRKDTKNKNRKKKRRSRSTRTILGTRPVIKSEDEMTEEGDIVVDDDDDIEIDLGADLTGSVATTTATATATSTDTNGTGVVATDTKQKATNNIVSTNQVTSTDSKKIDNTKLNPPKPAKLNNNANNNTTTRIIYNISNPPPTNPPRSSRSIQFHPLPRYQHQFRPEPETTPTKKPKLSSSLSASITAAVDKHHDLGFGHSLSAVRRGRDFSIGNGNGNGNGDYDEDSDIQILDA